MAIRADTIVVGDVELYYEIHGTGEPLLFLRFTGRGDDWRFISEDLAARWQIIGPDLRGHGRSTNPSDVFLFREAARDVRHLLQALHVGRVKAIGVSGGGIAPMHMAVQDHVSIESMVIVSAPPYFPGQARVQHGSVTTVPSCPEGWDELRKRHARGDVQISALMRQARGFAESYDGVCFTPPLLKQITADTLIVFGDRDPLYPVRLALELYAGIPRAYLHVVPNGGHGPAFGAMAPPFLEIAEPFLAGTWRT